MLPQQKALAVIPRPIFPLVAEGKESHIADINGSLTETNQAMEKGEPMSSKSKRKPIDVSMHKAVSIAMTIFVWAWMSCFNPTQDDVNKLSAEVANIRESVGNGNLNVWMVRDAIKDEFGWEI